jgi:predicted ATPase
MAVGWRGGARHLWRPCPCRDGAIAAAEARDLERRASLAQAYAGGDAADDLDALAAQGQTLARFRREPHPAGPQPGEHPLDAAVGWLDAALAGGPRAVHADAASPPAMLYLTSPTRGCGKTHLAAGLALAARAAGQRAALVEEKRLLAAYWGASLDAQERLIARLAERTWLLVIDDLGRRPVRRQADEETTGVADVFDALLNRRYALGGWTIITSNRSPIQLLDQGTINSSTFSRIGQMTRRRLVHVWGEDQRLAERAS